MRSASRFIPLEENLPDDLQADDQLVPWPGLPTKRIHQRPQGRSYPEWLRTLGRVKPRNKTDHG